MSSEQLHEDRDRLRPATIDRHRAIVSLMEELEAIDWYDQRVDATEDPELAEILAHNRDEEKEHAAMVLEWLRRHDAVLDAHLRTYLFTSGSVLEIEQSGESGESVDHVGQPDGDLGGCSERPEPSGSLSIGDLREDHG